MPFPTYDPLGSMDSGAATGLAIGAQAFNNNLNLQKLKSEDAVRRAQIQLHNQQLSDLLYKHDMAVQEQADGQKAWARVAAESAPTVKVPIIGAPQSTDDTSNIGTTEIPNPNRVPFEESVLKNVAPWAMKYRPQEAPALIRDMYYGKIAAEKSAAEGMPPTVGQISLPDNAGKLTYVTPPQGKGPMFFPSGTGGVETTQVQMPDGSTTTMYRSNPKEPWKRMPESVNTRQAQEAERQTKQKILSEALKIDPAQVNEDGTLKPEGWASIQKQAQITPAMRTQIDKQQAEAAKVFGLGQQLADVLTDENVGFRGNITRFSEGIASQLIPGYKIGSSTDAATLAKEYNAALVRGMKSDSNIAEAERKTIQAALPDPTSWLKGSAQAKATLATTLEQWGNTSRQNADTLGKPMTQYWLTPDEVFEKLRSGEIDRAKSEQMMKNNGWSLIKRLRTDALRDANKPVR